METGKDRIRNSRKRTNILKDAEFKLIEYLCRIMPSWVNPDLLTGTGLIGSIITAIGLVLAIGNPYWLILSVLGFVINWFGDSLDGRLAYYRNIPRKWYGWALDLNVDWISTSVIGLGFYFYFPDWKVVAILFVVAYGGSMILALMRYKIIDKYTIDSHFLGPTELRIIISFFLVAEIFVTGILWKFALVGSLLLMVFNLFDSCKILGMGDQRDIEERGKLSA